MRELKSHIVKGDSANHQLKIEVTDEPGAGGANHSYLVSGFNTKTNVSYPHEEAKEASTILFQNGPIKEVGVNGLTHEALLAIVIDRLESFQKGPFSSAFNEAALDHCKAGLEALQERTRNRIARQVEGTHAA